MVARIAKALTSLIALCAFGGSMANADPIVVGQWYGGSFTTANTALLGGANDPILAPDLTPAIDAPNTPWEFTLGASGGVFTITDLGFSGDQFEIFDMGTSLGVTSASLTLPDFSQACLIADPFSGPDIQLIDCAMNDDDYSTGRFSLGAGTHSITGQQLGSINNGDFAFIVMNSVAEVPIPAAAWLFGSAILGLVGVAGRKQYS